MGINRRNVYVISNEHLKHLGVEGLEKTAEPIGYTESRTSFNAGAFAQLRIFNQSPCTRDCVPALWRGIALHPHYE